MVGIKHESMRKGQTSHKKEHNTRMCFPLKPVFTRDKGGLPNFMDEPTVGLDVMARNEMLDMLRDYMEEDEERSILVSSHISTDLETLCDNIYMINEGNIILHEETDRLLSNYAILKVDEEQSKTLDPQYIIKMKKESYGYACLTDQKQFYLENYPKIVVEKGTIDQIITLMIQGV